MAIVVATETIFMCGCHVQILPIIVHTGQVCTLLVAPHMFLAVPLVAGSGPFTLFHVPNNPALRGIRVYAQGGMPVHYGAEEGFSRGTEMVIQ